MNIPLLPAPTYDSPTKSYARAQGGQKDAAEKLRRQMQFEVCLLIAYGHTDRFISEEIMRMFEFTVHWTTINQNYRHGKKWRKTITYLRERYLNNLNRRPCMKKTWRLKGLESAYVKAIEEGNLKSIAQLHSEILDEVEGRQKIEITQKNETKVFQDAGKSAPDKTEQEIMADLNRCFKKQFESAK